MILIGLGVAIAVVAFTVLLDEWRRSNTQHARIFGLGLRLELLVGCALALGLGVAMTYAGIHA